MATAQDAFLPESPEPASFSSSSSSPSPSSSSSSPSSPSSSPSSPSSPSSSSASMAGVAGWFAISGSLISRTRSSFSSSTILYKRLSLSGWTMDSQTIFGPAGPRRARLRAPLATTMAEAEQRRSASAARDRVVARGSLDFAVNFGVEDSHNGSHPPSLGLLVSLDTYMPDGSKRSELLFRPSRGIDRAPQARPRIAALLRGAPRSVAGIPARSARGLAVACAEQPGW